VQRRGIEAAAGIEPAIRDLQSPALPLGYAAEATQHDTKKPSPVWRGLTSGWED
jgi:hypothetical protein